jgi:hypothetical protein
VIALPPFKPSNLAEAIQELGYYVDIEAANGTTAIEMAWDNSPARLGAELISDQVEIARQMLGSNLQSLTRFKN